MAMKYSCPKCGVGLVFDPQTQMLRCEYCDTSFTVQEVKESKLGLEELIRRKNKGTDQTASEEYDGEGHGTISMKLLRCNSCGAKLAFSNVETSSYCAYCGQPTIATERLQDFRRPDFIIPFKVTKERAERLIREQIENGRFIPDEIRKFEPERICGIYIPYWLFDVYTSDGQLWKYGDGDDGTFYAYYAADSEFHRVTYEASRRFNDSFSSKLEPYRMDEVMRFDETYLSGFYSDQFDVDKEEAGAQVRARAKRMFLEEITKRRKAMHVMEVFSHPVAEEYKPRYALLPVWFMTMRYRNKPYTVLVNGQTAKTVCSLPVNKVKAYGLFTAFALLFSALLMGLFAIINANLFNSKMSDTDQTLLFALIYIPITVVLFVLSRLSSIKRLFRIGKGVRDAGMYSNEELLNKRQGV
ncbi:MAG: hypothetical protein IKI15_07560 [Lachnospiraceae bacterium]|nr:hypothetical protein [Lachnospiraceae bacterium]